MGKLFGHLFALRPGEKRQPDDAVDDAKIERSENAQATLDFAASRYHAILTTRLEAMISSAFKDMKGGSDVAAGRASGIQEVKEQIRLDISRAKKALNG